MIADQKNQYPKGWNPRKWTVAGIFLFIFAVGGLYVATRYYVGHPNDTPAFVAGVIGLVTLYAIVVQIFVSRMQWQVMQATLEQSQRFFDETQRPSLGMVGEMEWGEDVFNSKQRYVQVTLRNSGKSPAVNVVAGITTGYAEGTFPRGGECPEPNVGELLGMESRNVIAIGGDTFLSSKNVTEDEFKLIYTGKAQLFIWVHATYCKNPSQKEPYVFEIYSRYNARTGTFAVCGSHNNAT